jgi:DNA mismatch endonuclease (patch repair protein)
LEPNKTDGGNVDPKRSMLMSRIGPKDTKPELAVRKLLHSLGYRFRLHRKDLPGTPDICLPGRKKILFVHGCFWHRHEGCRKTTIPKTRTFFWEQKFNQNMARDDRNVRALHEEDWEVFVIWECQTKDISALQVRLISFLDSGPKRP